MDKDLYLANAGELAEVIGDYTVAKDYFEQALARDLETYGEDHSNVAKDRSNLGLAWQRLGEYQKAIGYLEQALASDIEIYGENRPTVARDCNNLGRVWQDFVEYQTAVGYYELAPATTVRDPIVAAIRGHNLRVRDYQKAIGYLKQALASNLNFFGEDHPDVVRDLHNLGAVWMKLGRYQTVISYYE